MLPLPQQFWVDPVGVSLSLAVPALLQGSQTAQHQHTDMFLLLLPPSPLPPTNQTSSVSPTLAVRRCVPAVSPRSVRSETLRPSFAPF